jgi:hypothetical protein
MKAASTSCLRLCFLFFAAAAGYGTGYYGFKYPTPTLLKDGQTHWIWVQVSVTHFTLGTTPKSLACSGP